MDYRQSYIHANGMSPSECRDWGFLCSMAGRISFGAKVFTIILSLVLLFVIYNSGMHKSQGFMYAYVLGMGSFVSYLLYQEWNEYRDFIALAP